MSGYHSSRHHHFHGFRILLGGVLLLAVLVGRVPQQQMLVAQNSEAVLAYATSMSRGDLHSGTNSNRQANGLPSLTLDGTLNNSAQMKAQHMVDNDYWAHIAPDGTQPWYFFSQAGYNYRNAGENLAYGFSTSSATIQGWMNSPSHRDNILGDYKDVGFGIVNGANYQGGNNTVVVAHYGTRISASPTPAAEPTPEPEPAPAPATVESEPAPQPLEQPVEPSEPETPSNDQNAESEQATEEVPKEKEEIIRDTPPPDVATAGTASVSLLDSIRGGQLPLIGMISSGLLIVAAAGYLVTHRAFARQMVLAGEHFALKHPATDALLIAGAIALVLTTTIANIG